MIPKVFHSVWLGPKPIPDAEKHWIDTWLRLHPGWEHRIWTDNCLPPLTRPDLYEAGVNWAQKSDVLRFELMAGPGGVYLDTDMECLQNIEPLTEICRAFLGNELPDRAAQGILGSEPGHPLFKLVLESMDRTLPWIGNNLTETGPEFFAKILHRYLFSWDLWPLEEEGSDRPAGNLTRDDLAIFEPWVFYPYYIGGKWDPAAYPDCFAAHHWAGSWL